VVVGPGHGPYGTQAVLEDQQLFFQELYRLVRAASAGKSAAEIQSGIETMKAEVARNTRVARYVGKGFASQVAKVYNEITGQSFPDRRAEVEAQQLHLARHHGHGEGGHHHAHGPAR
jgi:hypothetical protein